MIEAQAEPGAERVLWTLGLCFLAALAEGFDIQSMGVAAPRMAPALALSRDQLGPVFSASTLGLLIGAVAFGRLADRVGRKFTLVLSLAIFGVFSAATAGAWSFASLLTIRLLAGLGLGGALPNLIALSAEAVAEHRRARLVTLVTSGFPFGAALASGVAAFAGWRAIFWVGGATPLVLAPLMAAALPESRRFLASLRARATGSAARTDFVSILFRSRRGLTTCLLWTAFFCALLSLYLLLNWLPTLMGDKGVGKTSASLIALLFNLGTGPGVIIAAMLLDRGRRALTVAVWYACLIAAVVALATANATLGASGTASFAVGFFLGATPLVLYGLAPGYYPVIMRGAGVGASVAAGRLGAIVGPLFAAALLGAGAGATGVLLALLPLVAIAGAATIALLGRPTVAD